MKRYASKWIQSVALGAALAVSVTAPAAAAPGDIVYGLPYGGSQLSGSIVSYDPDSGATRTLAASRDLSNPSDIAYGPEGELYVTDSTEGVVFRIDPSTGAMAVVSSGGQLSRPHGVAYSAERRLYVADVGPGVTFGSVFRINPGSLARMQLPLTSILQSPTAVTVAGDGAVVISDIGPLNGLTGGLVRLHSGPRGDTATPFAQGLALKRPVALATAGDGSVIVADTGGSRVPGELYSINANGDQVRQLVPSGTLAEPVDVAADRSGAVYVLDVGTGTSGPPRVLRVDPSGGTTEVLAGAALDGTNAIAVEPPRCHGRIATVVGSDRGEVLSGTRFPDVVAALGGNDTVSGFNGNDIICGGAGNDRINSGKGFDVLIGGTGRDRLNGSAGDDRLDAGPGADRCDGRGGRDAGAACEARQAIP